MDDDSNEVDGSDVESNYKYQPSGSVSDSDASLVDSLDYRHVMVGIPGRFEPYGDKFGWENSSGEEDGPTRMVRYCIDNEWTPNSDGSISLRAGQFFSNAKEPMNKEANSKWIAVAFGALILLNPSIEAAVIKNELRDKFGVKASSQSIYRAKKRVLKNLRTDHIEAYTMIWRYANMCIVMNPEDRDKPIITLFETLRRKIMVRFTDKWDKIEKLNDTITSYTRNRLNETDNEARKLQVIHGRGEYHETMDSRKKPWLVNIGEKTCDFGEWQEAFQTAYSGTINPIPDASQWPTMDNVPLDPPLRSTLVGRPKNNRRREPDEGTATGRIFSSKCKKCGTIGHNKRTCTGNSGSK
ncbi:hypothetical protein LWI28_027729 [Acer negundo]|uniref:CCHC-type domain-containing protein n=1 Tax=Acer negundo TaxID=4023 RepID=A0AAD5INA6_ACENE|nr:hypothetical protein LWI28_027729 [Acer negundo]